MLVRCLKDGELVETGTHRELVVRNGEYSKLYNIQARAFVELEVGGFHNVVDVYFMNDFL